MQEVNLTTSCSQLTKFGVRGFLLIPGAVAMLSAYSFGCRTTGDATQSLLQCSRPSTDKGLADVLDQHISWSCSMICAKAVNNGVEKDQLWG